MFRSIFFITLSVIISLTLPSCGKNDKSEQNTENNIQSSEDKADNSDTVDQSEVVHEDRYICPMDCEKGKTYAEKGKCPVCKMDLALKETEHKDHEGHEDELDHEGHKDEKDHEGHDH